MAAIRIDMILQDVGNSIGRSTQAVQNLNNQLQTTQRLARNANTGTNQLTQYNASRATGAGSTGSSSRDFAAQAQGLGGLVRLYATFAANIYAAGAAFQALQQASNFDNLMQASKMMAVNTGVDLTRLSKNLQTASNYALSLEESMQFANIGTSAGIAAKQLTSLVQIARGAAAGLGRDVQDSIRRIVQGTAKQEQEILDELGIFIKSKKAYEDFAKKFGIEGGADALTAQQRVAAYADAVEKAGEKWKEFSQIDDPFSRIAATSKSAIQDILTNINDLIKPILSLLSESKSAIKGILLLIGGLLTIRGLPEIKSIFSNLFSFNKNLLKAQAEQARAAIQQELATTNVQIVAARAQLQQSINQTPQFGRAELAAQFAGSGIGLRGAQQGLSLQRLGSNILGTTANPQDLTRLRTVADVQNTILGTVREQVRATRGGVQAQQALLDTLIRTNTVQQGSTLNNIRLSQQALAIGTSIFNTIQTTNTGLAQQATFQQSINQLLTRQATLQQTIQNTTPGAVLPLQRMVGVPAPSAPVMPPPAAITRTAAALQNFSAGAAAATLVMQRMGEVAGGSLLTRIRSFGVVLRDTAATFNLASTAAGKFGVALSGLAGAVGVVLKGLFRIASPLLLLYSLFEIFGDKIFPGRAAARELEQANKDLAKSFAESSAAIQKNIDIFSKSSKGPKEYLNYVQNITNAVNSQIESIDSLIKTQDTQGREARLKREQELARRSGEAAPTALSLGIKDVLNIPDIFTPEQIAQGNQLVDILEKQTSLVEKKITKIDRETAKVQARKKYEQEFYQIELERQDILSGNLTAQEQSFRLNALGFKQQDLTRKVQLETSRIIRNSVGDVEANNIALTESTEEARKFLLLRVQTLQQMNAEAGQIETNINILEEGATNIGKLIKKTPKLSDLVKTEDARAIAGALDKVLSNKKFDKSYESSFNGLRSTLQSFADKGVPEANDALVQMAYLMDEVSLESNSVEESIKKLYTQLVDTKAFDKFLLALDEIANKYGPKARAELAMYRDDIADMEKRSIRLEYDVKGIEQTRSIITDINGFVSQSIIDKEKKLKLDKIELDYSNAITGAVKKYKEVMLDNTASKQAKENAQQEFANTMDKLSIQNGYNILKEGEADFTRIIANTLGKISKESKENLDIQKQNYQIKSDSLSLETEYLSILSQMDRLHYSIKNSMTESLKIQKIELDYVNEVANAEIARRKAIDEAIAKSSLLDPMLAQAVVMNAARDANAQYDRSVELAKNKHTIDTEIARLMRQQADTAGILKEVLEDIEYIEQKRSLNADLTSQILDAELGIAEARISTGKVTQDQYNSLKRQTDLLKVQLKYEDEISKAKNEYTKNTLKITAGQEVDAFTGQYSTEVEKQLQREKELRDFRISAAGTLKTLNLEQINSIGFLTERQQGYFDVAEKGFSSLSDAIVQFTQTGEFSWKNMINNMLADMLRFELQMQQRALFNALRGALVAAFSPTAASTYSATGGIEEHVFNPYQRAKGAAYNGGVEYFAKGGMFTNSIVDQPTTFKFAKGVGLMGEAGPEAIMPLKRDSSGNLGVRAQGGDTKVVVNNYGSEKAETRETTDSRGNRRIEVTIGEMAAGEIGRSGSSQQRALKGTYGLRPQLIRR